MVTYKPNQLNRAWYLYCEYLRLPKMEMVCDSVISCRRIYIIWKYSSRLNLKLAVTYDYVARKNTGMNTNNAIVLSPRRSFE